MNQEQTSSAKIYQFPVGGRAGLRTLDSAQRPAVVEAAMLRGSTLAVGESWYHAEAIQAAQQAIT